MPRAKKAPGNQHNSRHENGIVAPGKRVTKQKSNGHLNGSVDTPAQSTTPSIPLSAARTTAALPETRINGAPTQPKESSSPAVSLTNGSPAELAEVLEAPAEDFKQDSGSQEQVHRKIDNSAARSSIVHRDSIFNLALTILRACPLGDTIAILLVLLWLPPTLLTVTNALFAVLTFMPPTVALPTFPPTFNDLFVGSGGTPSLATIFLTDVIGLVLWLVIWTPMQTLAIELAQAVVATTLGGGSSGKKQGSDSTLFCMSILTINHVARHDWLPRQIFGFNWPAILSSIPYVSKGAPSFLSDLSHHDYITTRSPAGWIRVLVALHILIQGLVHVARRWYQKREYAQAVPVSKKADPEAVPGTPTRSNIVPAAESGISAVAASTSEGPGKLALSKDARDKVSSGKKKRRQGTLVRSQQPLWAAFAATKLTVLREFEQSQAQKEVADSKATDVKHLGSAQFAGEGGRVWVFDVQPNSFRFETSLSSTSTAENLASETDISIIHDPSKPFRVRINDTDWTSTRFERREDDAATDQWTGEVFGLSPTSSYRCTFIRGEDGAVIHSTTITTPASITAEKESSAPSTELPLQTYRPQSPKSPTTTLKKSITAFETSLNDSQARQKRLKKEIKAGSANLKRDLDILNSKITKLGGEDKAHTNRHLQWNQHTRQADDAVVAISSEIESLGCVPEEDVKLSKETKATWDEVRNAQISARQEMFRTKDAAHRERSSVQTEATTSQQKRERLLARKTKLHDQHERLGTATAHGIDEKERKNSEQAAKDLERAHFERNYVGEMQYLGRAIDDARYSTNQMLGQRATVEAAFHERQMLNNMPPPEVERPLTPEGDLPGTNPQHVNNTTFRVSAFGSPDNPNSGLRSHSGSLRHNDTRPRSTSGLSGTSVYADFEDQDPAPPMPPRAVEVIRERGHMHSRNSGSGSSGSQRDPASPVGGHGVQVSPVGKRSPVWNP